MRGVETTDKLGAGRFKRSGTANNMQQRIGGTGLRLPPPY